AGGAAMSRVNFIAEVAWEGAEISADYYGEDLELVWHASADPGNTFCKTPGLLDLHATANTSRSGSLRTVLRGLTSYVQLDFSAQIAGGEWKAKAGDAFTLVPHGSFAHSDLGERFWKTRKVTLEAGAKLIHVTVPSTYSYEAVARHLRPALQQDVARFKA